MCRFCVWLARFLLSAWVGAAVLFVINGINILGKVPSPVLDRLLVIRFTNYYRFGFVCVAVSLAAVLYTVFRPTLPRWRHVTAVLLVAAALGLMCYDFQTIYRPLADIVTPPGQPRPMEFGPLHERSKMVNSIHVGLCLAAAWVLCWPVRVPRRNEDTPE